VIISLKTQSDNWILIETIHKILAYMSVDNKLVPISNIEDINISILTHYYVFLLNQKSISLRPLYLLILMNLILIFVQKEKDDIINSILKHQRWCDKFSKFQVDIVYHPGKANLIVDALSSVVRKDFYITNVCIRF